MHMRSETVLMQVVAEHLSVEEVAGIKDMFEKMDINNEGQITFEELKYGLHKLGHQIADADAKILMEAVGFSFLLLFRFSSMFACQYNNLISQ